MFVPTVLLSVSVFVPPVPTRGLCDPSDLEVVKYREGLTPEDIRKVLRRRLH